MLVCQWKCLNTDPNDKNNKFSRLASYMILEGELDSKELSSISFNLVRLPYDINKRNSGRFRKSNMVSKIQLFVI